MKTPYTVSELKLEIAHVQTELFHLIKDYSEQENSLEIKKDFDKMTERLIELVTALEIKLKRKGPSK